MGRRRFGVALLAVCWLCGVVAAVPAFGAERCVGSRAGCYPTLQAALDAAQAGDAVRLAHGTFTGGATVTKSVDLVGAGRDSTTLRGGGPVLTIGTFGAATEPTVSIRGMTITGGRTTSSPESVPFVDKEGVVALGGGIEIPPADGFTTGATVTVSDAVITDNRVAPSATVPVEELACPGGPCPFALAAGGGIDNWGTLTIERTTISRNRVGSASGLSTLASDANSGAIQNWAGSLTIRHAVIAGNEAGATAPNGRFVDSGAIFVERGELAMSDTVVAKNRAVLAAALPANVDVLAIAGAIHLSDQVPRGRISDSAIVGNAIGMTNTAGNATAFSAGVHVDDGVDFEMRGSTVTSNHVFSATRGSSPGDAEADSGAGELHGTLSGDRFTGNTVIASAAHGHVDALAGAAIMGGTFSTGEVGGNRVRAIAPHGTVTAEGGGLVAGDQGLTLRDSRVNANFVDARGYEGGSARGGGIADFAIPNGPPGGPLTLDSTAVTDNVVTGSAGILLQGGGLYAEGAALTLTHSPIVKNHPDQCVGCP
jgi:hypothetical protein